MEQNFKNTDLVLSTANCLFRPSNIFPFVNHRIELKQESIALYEEDDFNHFRLDADLYSFNPVCVMEINPMFYVVDTKLKHNRKHRGFHRVTFYDGYNNSSIDVFYTSKEKSLFKRLLRQIKQQGVLVTYTSLNAANLY